MVLEISGSNFKRGSRKTKWYRLILLIQFSTVLNGHHDNSLEITPYKGIQDNLESVQVLDSGFFINGTWIPDSNCWWEFGFLALYSGFQNPGSTVPQAKMSPDSGFQSRSLYYFGRVKSLHNSTLHTFVLCPYFSLFQVSVLTEGVRKETPDPLRLVSVGTNTKHPMNDSEGNKLN